MAKETKTCINNTINHDNQAYVLWWVISQQTQNIFQTFFKGHMIMFYNIKTLGQQNIIKKWINMLSKTLNKNVFKKILEHFLKCIF